MIHSEVSMKKSVLTLLLAIVMAITMVPGAGAATTSLDSAGYLLVNGVRTFPIGPYSVPNDLMSNLSTTGCNLAANTFWAQDTSSSTAFLNALGSTYWGIIGFNNSQALALNTTYLSNYINAVKGHSRLLSWYMPDEPISQGYSATTMASLYKLIKQYDPARIVTMADYVNPTNYRAAFDVFIYDQYPIGNTSINRWRDLLRTRSAEAAKPIWVALQTYVGSMWLEPTRTELFCMAYIAIANGAKGLLAYEHGGPPIDPYYIKNYPTLWTNYQALTNELKTYSPLFVSDDDSAVTLTASQAGADFKVKKYGGKHYIVAANYRAQSMYATGHDSGVTLSNVSIAVKGATFTTATVVAGDGKGRVLSASSGTFTDSFAPYGYKIYELNSQSTSTIQPPSNLRIVP
jgi:hypothetical protein